MKYTTIFLVIFLISCTSGHKDRNISTSDVANQDSLKIDRVDNLNPTNNKTVCADSNYDWQSDFDLSHDIDRDTIWYKPVRYYLEMSDCSQRAKDFYYGKKRPSDDEQTEKLLKLVLTKNSELRPFYRWILAKTIDIQDGALAEMTGVPARMYAEKFPNEFLEYMRYYKFGIHYTDWCNAINYSGYYDGDNWEKPKILRRHMIDSMIKNRLDSDSIVNQLIVKMAKDCFPEEEK